MRDAAELRATDVVGGTFTSREVEESKSFHSQ